MRRRMLQRYKKQGGVPRHIFSPRRQGKESNFSLPILPAFISGSLTRKATLTRRLTRRHDCQPTIHSFHSHPGHSREEPPSFATAIFNSRRDVHQPFPPEGLSSSTARQAERYGTPPHPAFGRSKCDEAFLAGTYLTLGARSYSERQEPLQCPAPQKTGQRPRGAACHPRPHQGEDRPARAGQDGARRASPPPRVA